MLLLIGLGNPGLEYAGTRHNIGFDIIDFIAGYYKFGPRQNKFHGQLQGGEIDGKKILTLKPMTFMNNSGVPTSEASGFYKIPLPDIYVFHDDLDLELGRIRVKTGGGNGGHNGLKSLDEHIGNEYNRIRIGIGHPGHKDLVTPYVLSRFTKEEKLLADKITMSIAENIPLLLNDHPDKFMTKIAGV